MNAKEAKTLLENTHQHVNVKYFADCELQYLRKVLNMRNQSLWFQDAEIPREEHGSPKHEKLFTEMAQCDELLMKLLEEE